MKAKPILLVVITLVIGFVLGMLTSAQIRFNRLKPVRVYFSAERFREGFYKILEPDEKQKAEIEKILDKYAKINSDLQSDIRKELDANMKEFRKELDSKLTKDQLARLKEMDERRQEMIRQGMRNHRDSSRQFNQNMYNRDRRDFRGMPPGMHGDRPAPPEGSPPDPYARPSDQMPDSSANGK
ncbi:MAG: hypothetical protein MUE74_07940 [Bacteroidales bacterium]|jgi:hypothetical protein|nr:hypothetical protein [Bacteroidales bacterium]